MYSLFTDIQSPKIYFSYPGRYTETEKKENVRNAILRILQNTKFDLKIYAYSLNDPKIIDEILIAKNRGVKISITLDNEKDYSALKEKNISYSVWRSSGLHHQKVIISDRTLVFFGTGNFTNYGLTQDHNGYIEFTLEEKNLDSFISLLENTYSNPILKNKKMCFMTSPKDGRRIQSQILREIQYSTTSIHYLIFDHFDPIISHSLKEASSRGVEVIGVYDSPTDEEGKYLKDSFYGFLSGIYRDGNEDKNETDSFPEGGLLHHKTMIIDKKKVLTGSYNYSSSARDSNKEIFMQIEDTGFVNEFENEFQRIKNKAYREIPEKFFTNKLNLNTSIENKTDEVCFSDLLLSPTTIKLGEGIFRTLLYYPTNPENHCITKKYFHIVSSNFSYPKSNSFLDLNEFWNNINIFERNSEKVYKNINREEDSIFQKKLPINFIQISFFDLTGTNIIFQTNRNDIEFKKITLFFPGDILYYATLSKYSAEQNEVLYGNVALGSNYKKTGIAFIELPDETLFFCFQKNGDSNKNAIEEFLSEWTVFQSFSKNMEIQKPSCVFY